MARPLSKLIKKDVDWCWHAEHAIAFIAIKDRLLNAPILAFPDPYRPFSVVCNASDFAIGSALLQTDVDGRERAFKTCLILVVASIIAPNHFELVSLQLSLASVALFHDRRR